MHRRDKQLNIDKSNNNSQCKKFRILNLVKTSISSNISGVFVFYAKFA